MIGYDAALAVLEKAMDGTWQKQRAIANNIANFETPKYKAIHVSFEASLKKEVDRLSGNIVSQAQYDQILGDIKDSKIKVYSDPSTSEREDGNNVNLDTENIEMAKTQLQYEFLTRSMTDLISRMRYAVTEGKK